jgi:hypothetical protein
MTGRQPPSDIVAAAQAAFRQYPKGAPVCVLLAQWADESGWGEHTPPGSNNPFGEKALPGQAHVDDATTEVIRGHLVPANAPFRAFPSIREAFAFHAGHLATSDWFIDARACLPDVRAFCDALGGGTPARPNYSTSPRYGAELWAVIQGSNLTRYDIRPGAGPMTDTSTTPAPSQLRAATMDMLRSVLMALGSSGAVASLFSGQQWGAVVGGLLAVVSAIWSYAASHPSKIDPLTALMALVAHGGQASVWDAAAERLAAAAVPLLEARADAIVRARAGILAAPLEGVEHAAVKDAAAQAVAHLKIT